MVRDFYTTYYISCNISIDLGFKSILAMCVLALMVPDARCKYDHTKVITLLNVSLKVIYPVN